MKHLNRFALSSALLTTTVGLIGCPDPIVSVDTGTSMIDTGEATDDTGAPVRDAGRDTGTSRDAAINRDAFAPRCGDGAINGGDVCDDSNMTAGDGCSATCTVEAGFACNTASPTVCTATCGDGMRVGAEAAANGCDDGNTAASDGCSATCGVEAGFSCTGAPSVCMTGCGDGIVAGAETCDDGNTADGDGCAMSCASETGYVCMGAPSTCAATCGDGLRAVGRETCDDMNVVNMDGCSSTCATEPGYTCTGTTCTATCGDGMTVGTETCDDGNAVTEACVYGTTSCTVCNATCQSAPGAATFCGDSTINGGETCDDGNTVTETVCAYGSATCTLCNATCAGSLTLTGPTCGDGIVNGPETCDDGFRNAGDGCSATCTTEAAFVCTGAPSRCSTTVSYTGPVLPVPDNNPMGVLVPVSVAASCTILDVATTHRWEPDHAFARDLIISVAAPSNATAVLSNRVGAGNDLDGPYVFAATGTAAWPGAGNPIAAGTYPANYSAIRGGPSAGLWNLFVADVGSGDVGSISEFSVTITCAPSPTVLPATPARTCGEILAAGPRSPDGTYIIDPDGSAGVLAPARVYCDMTNGGWTLVMASNRLGTDAQTASATVLPNSGTYLPVAFARALATAGTQVHIRTAGAIATRSITSVANMLPIQNLRAGLVLTNNSPFRATGDSVAALWTGPFAANAQYLWHTCGPAPFSVSSASYPSIYHACGNAGGMHLNGPNTGWTVADGENMEVYVR